MLRQKRNLSVFRQYQEQVAEIPSEETYISDYSEDENEENHVSNRSQRRVSDSICTNLNLSMNRTTQQSSFYYTPPAKRIKRVPLSTVSHKKLQGGRSKRPSRKGSTLLFRGCNSAIKNGTEQNITFNNPCENDEDEFQELTIEWSSSDEADNTKTGPLQPNSSQSFTQNSNVTTLDGSQKLPSSTSKETNLFKRCRKGGYLHQLKQNIDHLRMDRKFLEHDKKFGIRQCLSLRVLKVESSFGVHLATVCSEDDEVSEIVLDADTAKHTKTGSILEAFPEQMDSYDIEYCDKKRQIYIHPTKFMLRLCR